MSGETDRMDYQRSRDLLLALDEAQQRIAQLEAENASLAAWQCRYTDGKEGLVCDEYGNQYCAKNKRIAELEAERRWIPVTERLPSDDEMDWIEVGIRRSQDIWHSLVHVTEDGDLESWDGDDLGYSWQDVSMWRNADKPPAPGEGE